MKINTLSIENFKSIEKLDISTTRVNVFIGGPNAGKTNILEALSTHSIGFPKDYKDMIRFDEAADLFIDLEISKKIKIETNELACNIEYDKNESGALLNRFKFNFLQNETGVDSEYILTYEGKLEGPKNLGIVSTRVMYYIFRKFSDLNQYHFHPFLSPPFGDNISNLLITNSSLRKLVSNIFADFGLKIILRKSENKISIVREEDGSFIDYKYQNISSTVQRIVFMLLAIKSNDGNTIIFDEPEANIFPFYAQNIANHIANESRNQFFMTSHSAYLINKLIDKTPAEELSIFYTEMKNFRTVVKKLDAKEVERFASMGEDAMLNLSNIIE